MKKRLIRWLLDCNVCVNTTRKAEYLLKQGVIAPPCRIRDTVYFADKTIKNKAEILTGEVIAIGVDEHSNIWINIKYSNGVKHCHISSDFGKCLFLTKEEAENIVNESQGAIYG